jgi:integrase
MSGRCFSVGNLVKEKRGNGPERWVLDWRKADGTRQRVALSTDRRVAERRRAEMVRSRDLQMAGLGSEEGQDRLLTELLALYIADLRVSACPRHVKNVSARLTKLIHGLAAKRVREVVAYPLMQHRAARVAAGKSVRTANLEVDSLKAMLNWALRAGLIAANPIIHMPRLPERESTKVYRRRALSEVEITRFLRAAREDDRANAERAPRVPQTALWRVLLECGPRYGETVSTTWADLDVEQGILCLRAETTKARRERRIPLRRDLVDELLGLKAAHSAVLRRPLGPRDRVFLSPHGQPWSWSTVNLGRILHRVLEAAGIDRKDASGRTIDVHALRHSAATRMARNGVPLAVTQRILGHSDPKLTSKVYQHLEVEDLRSAVEQLAPENKNSIGVA